MRHKLLLGLLLAAIGAPAAAANSLTVDDPCGDGSAYVIVDGERANLPATDRGPEYDIDAVRLDSTATGVRVSLVGCGPVTEADQLGGGRALFATLPDGCALNIVLEDETGPSPARTASFRKTCFRPDTGPTAGTPLSDESDERFAIDLPASAVTVSGSTIAIDVNRAGMSGEAAAALAPGTAWSRPGAISVEATNVYGFGFTYGGPTSDHWWSFSGPMGSDSASGESDFLLD